MWKPNSESNIGKLWVVPTKTLKHFFTQLTLVTMRTL